MSFNEWKESELGRIPFEWEVVKIEEIADVVSGGTPSTKKLEYYGDEIAWITPKDLSGYTAKYISKGERGITQLGLENSSAKLLPPNTVLFSSRAPIGYVAISQDKVTTNQGFKNLVCDSTKVDYQFMYYKMKTLKEAFESVAGGSTFKEVSGKVVKEFNIILPTLSEQKAIANILSSLDEKIELNNQMNKTLEEMAQALFKRWFVDFEFPNENGEPYKSSGGEMVDSELGMIPKGWKVGCLGELIKVQNGYAFKSKDLKDDGEVRVIKIKNISGNRVDINETQFVSQEVANQTNLKFVIHPFDILIAMTGAEVGKIGLVPNNLQQLLLNQRVGNIQEVLQGGKAYAFSILTKNSTQEIILAKAMGSAQPNISSSGIEEIKIIVPCAKTLKEFNQIINPTIIKKGENDFENNYLENLRDTLLPKLMSGEIRVTDQKK